jgi:hypothetical protein
VQDTGDHVHNKEENTMLYSLMYFSAYLFNKIAPDIDEQAWARQRARFKEAIAQAERAGTAAHSK